MRQAAAEEIDHLAWCEGRLKELNGRTSLLNPLWYAGSLAIGALAGALGDRISLGFIARDREASRIPPSRSSQSACRRPIGAAVPSSSR